MNEWEQKRAIYFAKIAVVLVVALYILMSSFFVVGAGAVYVIVRLGDVVRVCNTGLHAKIPFLDSKVKLNIRIQKEEYEANSASNDLQSVSVKIAHNFSINPKFASTIYKTVGSGQDIAEKIIKPAVFEVIKGTVAKYTAEELVTKRDILRDTIKEALRTKLEPYGIITDDVSIINIDFSDEFNNAIEQKLIAEQNALKAERDLVRIKTEAEQKIATAKAEAESLRVQKGEVTPYMVQLRWIEKWNGVLPQTTGVTSLFHGVGGTK